MKSFIRLHHYKKVSQLLTPTPLSTGSHRNFYRSETKTNENGHFFQTGNCIIRINDENLLLLCVECFAHFFLMSLCNPWTFSSFWFCSIRYMGKFILLTVAAHNIIENCVFFLLTNEYPSWSLQKMMENRQEFAIFLPCGFSSHSVFSIFAIPWVSCRMRMFKSPLACKHMSMNINRKDSQHDTGYFLFRDYCFPSKCHSPWQRQVFKIQCKSTTSKLSRKKKK